MIKNSPPSQGQVYVFAAKRRLVSAGYLLRGGADVRRVWPDGTWVEAQLADGGLAWCGRVENKWEIRHTRP